MTKRSPQRISCAAITPNEFVTGASAAEALTRLQQVGWAPSRVGWVDPGVRVDADSGRLLARAVDDPTIGSAFATRGSKPRLLMFAGKTPGSRLGGTSVEIEVTESLDLDVAQGTALTLLAGLAEAAPLSFGYIHIATFDEVLDGRMRGTYPPSDLVTRVFSLTPKALWEQGVLDLAAITVFPARASEALDRDALQAEDFAVRELADGSVAVFVGPSLKDVVASYSEFEGRRKAAKRILAPVLADIHRLLLPVH